MIFDVFFFFFVSMELDDDEESESESESEDNEESFDVTEESLPLELVVVEEAELEDDSPLFRFLALSSFI